MNRAGLQRAVEAEQYEVAADIRKQMTQLEVSVSNKRARFVRHFIVASY